MQIEQARSLVRYAFSRLWRGGLMEVRDAFVWLLDEHGIETPEDVGSLEQAERVVGSIAGLWARRCEEVA